MKRTMLAICVATALAAHGSPSSERELRQIIDSGRFEEAVAAAREELNQAGAADSLHRATLLEILAEGLIASGWSSFPETRSSAETALSWREQVQGLDHVDVARSLRITALVHLEIGNAVTADSLLSRALNLRERALGRDHVDVAEILHDLSTARIQTARFDDAASLAGRSIAIRRAELGPQHRAVALSLANLSIAHRLGGDYQSSREASESALAILEDNPGNGHPLVAISHVALSQSLMALGDFATSIEHLSRALEIRQSTLRSGHPLIADVLYQLGICRIRAGDFSLAEKHWSRALSIWRDAYGTENRHVAAALCSIGTAKFQQDDPESGVEYIEQSLSICERVQGTNHPDYALKLQNYAVNLAALGRLDEARNAAAQALEIRESVLSSDHPEVAMSLSELGAQHVRLGHPDEALALFERAREIFQESAPMSVEYALLLYNMGETVFNTGDYQRACSGYEKALAIMERSTPEHIYVANILNNLAICQLRLGRYSAGAASLLRARDIRAAFDGPEHANTVLIETNLASAYLMQGDYASALPIFERSVELTESTYGPDSPNVAFVLNNLANVLLELGDSDRAKVLFIRALDLRERLYGPDHPAIVESLSNLATFHVRMGDLEAAIPLLERAIMIIEDFMGPDHLELGPLLNSLGLIRNETGEYDEAARLLERSLRIREDGLGPDHPDLGPTLHNLGNTYRARGQPTHAIAAYERALAIGEQAYGRDHPKLKYHLHDLALVRWQNGESDEALRLALEASRIRREHVRLTARSIAEHRGIEYSEVNRVSYHLAVSLAVEGLATNSGQAALNELVRSRAIVMDEIAARRRSAHADLELGALDADLRDARTRLSNLVIRGPAGQAPDQYRAELEMVRREKENAERALAERSAPFAATLAKHDVDLDQVIASLAPRQALLSFVSYDRYGVGDSANPRDPFADPVRSYAAFVLRADDSRPRVIDLGPAATVADLVAHWRSCLAQPSNDEQSYRQAAVALRDRIWDPVADDLDRVEHLYVVPDGVLQLVNLTTLPDRDGRYLLESGPTIEHLSCERDLASMVMPLPGKRRLLAIGALDFEASDTDDADSGGFMDDIVVAKNDNEFANSIRRNGLSIDRRFEPLPATGAEVTNVAAIFREFGGVTDPAAVTTLTGSDADESTVKSLMTRHRCLHLATHGFFLGSRNRVEPFAAETDSDEDTPSDPLAFVSQENPLLLSGLVLSGANRRDHATPGTDDGILTAEEIAGLDLFGAELVVLSACDTGLGEIVPGEGVLGLRRAFATAGAGTLIMSLWAVADQPTRQWMEEFYRRLLDADETPAAAARGASAAMLQAQRSEGNSTHPFTWGAFVVVGDRSGANP